MKHLFKILSILLLALFISCVKNEPDINYLGYVDKLPKGEYTIYNYGSRHIVKCDRHDGKYYYLNDVNFDLNNIKGHDAHEYINPTKIVIQ